MENLDKLLLGLLAPSAGTVRLFGLPPRTRAARSRLGYLPELSYLHPFLTARETLHYYAGLSGIGGKAAKARCTELLEQVGADEADAWLRAAKMILPKSKAAQAFMEEVKSKL